MSRFSAIGGEFLSALLLVVLNVIQLPILLVVGLAKLCCGKTLPHPDCVVITGASSGIGARLAIGYAQKGSKTIVVFGRSHERLAQVETACKQHGARVIPCVVPDVGDRAAMRRAFEQLPEDLNIDLVVANAGSTESRLKLDGVDNLEEAAYAINNINVVGVFNTIFPAIERMKKQPKGGQVALMSSVGGFMGLTGSAAYSASKAAVRVYGQALRQELYNRKIKVSVITPAFVKTPLTDAESKRAQAGHHFKISVDEACATIINGLRADLGEIIFPVAAHALFLLAPAFTPHVREAISAAGLVPPIKFRRGPRKEKA